jgi:hypothetical protein
MISKYWPVFSTSPTYTVRIVTEITWSNCGKWEPVTTIETSTGGTLPSSATKQAVEIGIRRRIVRCIHDAAAPKWGQGKRIVGELAEYFDVNLSTVRNDLTATARSSA